MEETQHAHDNSSIADELESYISHEEASQSQRFFNWLIDNIVMRLTLTFGTGRLVWYILYEVAPDYTLRLIYERSMLNILLISYLVAIFNYILYYTISEKAFKGYTIGKLITGSRAIREDGSELTWKDAFIRSVSRLVPFEILSVWFGGEFWHDKWAKTVVIKARR